MNIDTTEHLRAAIEGIRAKADAAVGAGAAPSRNLRLALTLSQRALEAWTAATTCSFCGGPITAGVRGGCLPCHLQRCRLRQ